MADTSYNERNSAQTARLRALVARLSEADLLHEVRDGWTVAAMLAHIGLLDRLRLVGWEVQKRTPERLRFFATGTEQDVINDASQPFLLALPPTEAARLTLKAAEDIDRVIGSLDPSFVEKYMEGAEEHERRMLDRSIHRSRHLDEIDEALATRGG